MKITKKYLNDLAYEVIGAAIEVRKEMGAGLLESIYMKCMMQELSEREIKFKTEVPIHVTYKGIDLGFGFRCDFLVEDCLIVELKAKEAVIKADESQVISHLKLMKKPKGVLINFNVYNIFKEGQKTFVNEYFTGLQED
jgi:GxxExxY protein